MENVVPSTRDELVALLATSIGSALHPESGRPVVVAEGPFPGLDRLLIDVSEMTIREEFRPAKITEHDQPGVDAGHFEVRGRPVKYGELAVDFELTAQETRLAFGRDEKSRWFLCPVAAAMGRFGASVKMQDLEAMLLLGVQEAASAHGVSVEKTELQIATAGDRSATVRVWVTAAKKVASVKARAEVEIAGRLTVDEALTATLSALTCVGEGALGGLVTGMIRHQITQHEGRSFVLTVFSLGSLKLRDLRIRNENGLQVEDTFGN